MRKLTILMTFLLFVAFQAAAQMQISGKVTNAESGEPIPGVSIVVKSQTTIGTTTDMDGNYSIQVPSDAEVLSFSFVGMQTLEETINGRSTINVQLEPKVQEMEEVLVVAYGTSKKSTFTGSASSVDTEDIEETNVASVEKALQGSIAGLQTSSGSGQPGANTSVLIRGVGSITAGTEPLYVIDGIPVVSGDLGQRSYTTNALASLEPSDIQSISVLKDATATSLYGSKAANGVILITTKGGQKGETNFKFTTETGITNKIPDNFDLTTTSELKQLYKEAYMGAGKTEAEAQSLIDGFPDENIDWLDQVFRTGSNHKYKLSARGGTANTKFFTSATHFKQDGIVIGSGLDRSSVRMNLTVDPVDWAQFGIHSTGSITNTDRVSGSGFYADPVTSSYFMRPWEPVYNEDGTYNQNIPYNLDYNPVAVTALDNRTNDQKRLLASGFALVRPINKEDNTLTIKSNFGIDYYDLSENTYWNPNGPSGEAYNGYSELATSKRSIFTVTNTVQWQRTLNDAHNIDLLVGQEAQESNTAYMLTANSQFPSDQVTTLTNGAEPLSASTSETGWQLASYFGRINYDFQGRYYVSASYRRDGSSKFGADYRWANFYSVGGSWRISEEGFMQGISMVDNLRLRSSYGTSGNSDIGNFAARGLYGFGSDYNGLPGSAPTQIANPQLKWEMSSSFNVGFDIGLMDRVDLVLDYYYKKTTDLLLSVPISSTVGLLSVNRNIGEMSNEGFEIELNTVNILKPLRWQTSFNFSFNDNTVDKLYRGEDIITGGGHQIIREGEPINTWNKELWAGVHPATGNPLWYDENHNIVTQYSQAYVGLAGTPHPKFQGGLGNSFSYKGLRLNVFFNYVYGNEIYNNSKRYIMPDGAYLTNYTDEQLERWQEPGDVTHVPRLVQGGNNNSNNHSSRYLEDGSFIKLKRLSLSYSLPDNLAKSIYMKNINVVLKGENLFTWTHFTGFDPEVSLTDTRNFTAGQSWFSYPQARIITLGLDITF